jgi:LCP family protein required for cell wall assembly
MPPSGGDSPGHDTSTSPDAVPEAADQVADGTVAGDGPIAAPTKRGRWRSLPWYHKTLVIGGSLLMVISAGTLALAYGLSNRYNQMVTHEPILVESLAGSRPENGPLNFLVLGTDSRAGEAADEADDSGARSDTILLVHISEGLHDAFIVSIPRDSWVEVPEGGDWGGGMNKINSAFTFGGAAHTARTVFELTQIPLDGAVIVNFGGIQKMVDAVGGVHVCPPYDVPNHHRRDFPAYEGWWKGECYDMSGEEAQVFVRQRYDVPGGDFGRIRSQQLVMAALAEKATSMGVITNPVRLDALLSTIAQSLTLDESMNLRDLAFSLTGIRPNDLTFATLPHDGATQIAGQSVVQLDLEKCEELFAAILADRTDEWLADNPQPDVASYNPTP